MAYINDRMEEARTLVQKDGDGKSVDMVATSCILLLVISKEYPNQFS